MRASLTGLIIIITLSMVGAQPIDSLDLKIGQMIMVGLGDFNSLDKQAPIFKSIKSGRSGGVILFEKNLNSKNTEQKIKEIIQYAQSVAPIPLFVSIDEEGGRVTRLKTKYGFPKTYTAQYLGTLDQLDSTYAYAKRTAGLMYRLGINMNFAPSVDVNVNPENPVIGKLGRSYSEEPIDVVRHAGKVIDAHELFGIATVLKHFPGHGSSRNDSHLGLADVSDTWRIDELMPYKVLLDSAKVRAIMTAHIVNAVVDERKLPATLSDNTIGGLLRDFLDYDGVVVSDDMQMKAISDEFGLNDAIKMAILAGVDILLFANNVPDYNLITAEQIHDIIKKFVKNGDISIERINQSYQRIITLKKNMGLIASN